MDKTKHTSTASSPSATTVGVVLELDRVGGGLEVSYGKGSPKCTSGQLDVYVLGPGTLVETDEECAFLVEWDPFSTTTQFGTKQRRVENDEAS